MRYDPMKVDVFPASQTDVIHIGRNGRGGVTVFLTLADDDVEPFIARLRHAVGAAPPFRARIRALLAEEPGV